jgi:hypothetical protein
MKLLLIAALAALAIAPAAHAQDWAQMQALQLQQQQWMQQQMIQQQQQQWLAQRQQQQQQWATQCASRMYQNCY